MKKLFYLTVALGLASAGCHKDDMNNGNGGTGGTVSPGQGAITMHWLYDIKDWIRDTDSENGYPFPSHFYAHRTNIKYVFGNDHSYTFTYVAMPENTPVTETGSWSFNDSNSQLTLTPSSGNPYTYKMLALRDEHMNWGYTYTTYDNEGIPNGTAQEIVPLFGEK